jgi:hypothetical protein
MEKARQENEKLIELERLMNEEKLKLLIKFERIKHIEDYYNVI